VLSAIIGDCMEPHIPDGSWCWFERGGAWCDGDIVLLLDPASREHLIKQMHKVGERWLMLSANLPAVWVRDHQVIGPLVRFVRDERWRSADPELTAVVNERNAELRRLEAREIERRTAADPSFRHASPRADLSALTTAPTIGRVTL
jgi:hypothetical protein